MKTHPQTSATTKRSVLAVAITLAVGLLGFLLASCNHSDENAEPIVRITEPLIIGLISPTSGQLGYYAQSPIKSVELAVSEINAAGGNVEISQRDSGTDVDVALNSARQFLDEGVHAIVGPYSSKVSIGVAGTIIGENVVMVSPAASTKEFTTYDDNGLLFRTAASNQLWAKIVAEEIVNNGGSNVAIIFRDDLFGRETAEGVQRNLQAMDVTVSVFFGYDLSSPDPAEIADQVSDRNIDALFLAAFDEGASILASLLDAGVRPPTTEIYVSAVSHTNLGINVNPANPGIIQGIIDINPTPHPEADSTFPSRLSADETPYNGTTYDAVIIVALASFIANSRDPVVFAPEIIGVTKGGEKCGSYAECSRLIEEEKNIDYDGASGPLEFTDAGEPDSSAYKIFRYNSDGEPTAGRVVIGS